MRITWFVLALSASTLLSNRLLSAQESPNQSCDVPLVVTRYVPANRTVELVKFLRVQDLTVRVGGIPGAPESASVDRGPKRVALILDASKKVPNDEWNFETEMAAALVEHARPEDKFAFLVVGRDEAAGTLLLSSQVLERLKELVSSRPSVDSSEKTYDALLAAVNRFDPPAFGDAIFLFGHPDDSGSRATHEQVQELILKNGLRFYAMSFTDPFQKQLPRNFDPNKRLPAGFSTGEVDKISHATGYFFSFHSIKALRFPGQPDLLKGFLGDLYAGIAEPYRLRISIPNLSGKASLEIAISGVESQSIRQDDVHYPHIIYPCSVPSTPIP